MLESHYYENLIEAGCDEAGRGCLAGAVYAAAVILPPDYKNELLNDSKQLTEKKRYLLREVIERDAVAWAVGLFCAFKFRLLRVCRGLGHDRRYRARSIYYYENRK